MLDRKFKSWPIHHQREQRKDCFSCVCRVSSTFKYVSLWRATGIDPNTFIGDARQILAFIRPRYVSLWRDRDMWIQLVDLSPYPQVPFTFCQEEEYLLVEEYWSCTVPSNLQIFVCVYDDMQPVPPSPQKDACRKGFALAKSTRSKRSDVTRDRPDHWLFLKGHLSTFTARKVTAFHFFLMDSVPIYRTPFLRDIVATCSVEQPTHCSWGLTWFFTLLY